jgi:hypothetical protein
VAVSREMPDFLCLFYAHDADPGDRAERWKQLPEWNALAVELRAAGILLANNALQPAAEARTLRTRRGQTTVTDGPFATTKETLVGYFLLHCADQDEALRHALRIPAARYGSVEVRPVMEAVDPAAQDL